MKTIVYVEVDPIELVEQWAAELTHEQMAEVILAADLAVADYAFTEQLIVKLQESLAAEGEPEA